MPMCMGGAANGPEGCTCLLPDERLEILEKRWEIMIQRIAAIEQWIKDNDPENPNPIAGKILDEINRVKVFANRTMKFVASPPIDEL